jgi:hypothetical protein
MTYFNTDRSGKTWHIAQRDRADLIAQCGVTNAGTQTTGFRDSAGTVPDGDTICPRCRSDRR